jgi:hypothetical protein
LLFICDFPELLRIHAEFSCHLDVGIRKVVSFSGINPYLIRIGYLLFLIQSAPPIFMEPNYGAKNPVKP